VRWPSSSGCWPRHSRYLHEAIVELAERLKATLPPALDAVLVVNSGSEANDLAWRSPARPPGDAGAVVTAYAYHGLTEATHALSPEEWAKGERPPTSPPSPRPTGTAAPTAGQAGWAERYAAHIDGAARSSASAASPRCYLDPAFTADGILVPPPAYLAERPGGSGRSAAC
jgi:4-aminobutyrate aminotransferase-like enzyme